MPQFAPVINTILFSMFIPFSVRSLSFCLLLRIARRGRYVLSKTNLAFTLIRLPEAALQRSLSCGSALPTGWLRISVKWVLVEGL